MNERYLKETAMLNFSSHTIKALIDSKGWREFSEYDRIGAIYDYVQNDILFGYNTSDTLTAEQVMSDGYGQCNTKATLLMAFLRGVGIPCRLHAFDVSKDFQKGATSGIVSVLAPEAIVHTWAEVLYNGQWLALEGVITDKKYFEAVKKKYGNIQGELRRCAIAVKDISTHSIDWAGESTYVQSVAVVNDYGVFDSPDEFFAEHKQAWGRIKNFAYIHYGRKIMNRNVRRIRNRK